MPVDPQVQVLLDQMAAMNAPGLGQMSVEETRTMMDQFSTMGGPGPDVASVENRTIPGAKGEIPGSDLPADRRLGGPAGAGLDPWRRVRHRLARRVRRHLPRAGHQSRRR